MNKTFEKMKKYLFTIVQPLNDSKIFAGLVILTLNLSSKMITLPMSRTVESVIKHNFSQYVLVFAIAWMGTREVLIASTVTIIFAICMEFLFNEKSAFCCLSKSFVNHKLAVLESFEGNPDILSKEEIDGAVKTLEKAQRLLTSQEKGGSK
jgi:hypothetical protein